MLPIRKYLAGEHIPQVFIVTGSSSGLGLELAYILYLHNAKVYIAVRSEAKASKAIAEIKSRAANSKGSLIFLHLDLAHLSTIKRSAETFLRDNDRLDVLWNNAGYMVPAQGSQTAQGYELQLGSNNIGPFLFTKLLSPILTKTAQTSPPDSVRVFWVSSNGAEYFSPRYGVDLDNMDYKNNVNIWWKYGASKAGNILQASELARRNEGIVSVQPILYAPIYGAYTQLFAGLSPEVTASHNGEYLVPWGHFGHPLRKDLVLAQKTEKEGGTGQAARFWEWCEEQVKPYL